MKTVYVIFIALALVAQSVVMGDVSLSRPATDPDE